MALWQVVAPDRERVVLCEGYIRHELKHGSYVRSEKIVNMFPEFFIRVMDPEEIKIKQPEPVFEEIKEEINEEIKNIELDKEQTPLKRKYTKRAEFEKDK